MLFTPVVRTSNSIPRSLLQFAKEKKIDVKLLDFELVEHQTLLKRPTDDEYHVVNDITTVTTDDMKNSATIILQEYSIKIFPFASENKSIKLSLAANKLKTKAVITIKEGTVFYSRINFVKELRKAIWYQKLRAGLFIEIFEPDLEERIEKLSKSIPRDKALSKDLKLTVALGLQPVAATDSKYEKVFEVKIKESGSLISGVSKDELVFKYMKPKDGENGRSCTGKYLLVRDPYSHVSMPDIDKETIYEKVLDDSIEYYAKTEGFVLFQMFNLSISNELKLKNANFKSTRNIESGDDAKDISLHVGRTRSASDDAIGSGVSIDVKELKVDGSVASNVNITADEVNIQAQTHKNSKLDITNTANIKLHRGDLTATDANIEVLESGKVTAHKSVYVKQMVGGSIIAPVVKVDELISNCTIIASERIEIKTIIGWDNKLIIDPHAIKSYHEEVEILQEKITASKKSFKVQTNSLDDKIKEHASRINRIKTFQQRVVQAKQTGKQPVKQDILRIKQYKKESDVLNATKEELAVQESQIKVLEEELYNIYNQDLNAKITSLSPYDGNSKIIFKDPNTHEELMASPQGNFETIYLELDPDGKKEININNY